MTGGRIICKSDTFLGVRHGSEAVIDNDTILVYFLSTDPLTRKYELDFMKEINEKGIGKKRIVVRDKNKSEIERYVDYVIEFNKYYRFMIPEYVLP